MDASLGLLIRFVLGTMFLAAGASKLSDLGEFADAIKHYRIIPGATAGAAARAISVTEVVLGAVLIVGAGIPFASLVGSVLLVVFAAAMAINLLRGRRIPCGCKRESEPIQIKHILRNGVAVAALLFLATLPTHPWAIDALMQARLLSFP
ncbi:MAG TPA: MauE/DoxX family redox-associated membrane protein [Actinomycetota bacterium]|nr:MauE/DoxX family redox-associated membrane protein [Actinomycetota bacterium]